MYCKFPRKNINSVKRIMKNVELFLKKKNWAKKWNKNCEMYIFMFEMTGSCYAHPAVLAKCKDDREKKRGTTSTFNYKKRQRMSGGVTFNHVGKPMSNKKKTLSDLQN